MKRRIWIPFIFAAAVIALTLTASTHRHDAIVEEELQPRDTILLNKVLDNSLSGSTGLGRMDADICKFMEQWEIKGASLSIMRNDSLVYSKGYGWADLEEGIRMEPGHILRMASVSKLITATGIMVLQEKGLLSLGDRVFGPDGILCDSIYTASVKDKRIFDITVEDLLRHKGGFTCGLGDPMFSTRDIIRQFRLECAPDSRTLTQCILTRRLGFEPGTSQSYSNFGYLLLSLVIEKLSGCGYEEFIQENVLNPAGCFDMHIANNYYHERYPNEVKYYMQSGAEPCEEYCLSGKMVERCYGGSNINALSGAGAWCGSTAELCRFVASIDGRPEVPDIIAPETVAAMTEYFDPDTFSLGWNDTKPDGEWTRTGTLAGTSALVKCYPDGECWIMITNTGTYRGPHFTKYTSSLFRRCRESFSASLPQHDLFRGV
ncbi:MAG: beta-lactamase family protein [Clostridium sp.]|nr:beta-lactamase family protein [Bacteroides sp.]MCM1198209.1 beta-lactamase family protein [Clostridium sp.]